MTATIPADLVRVEDLEGGALRRLRLVGAKGHVLDAPRVAALAAVFREAGGTPSLKALLLEAEGPHFCFGASVEEHLPDRVPGMLRGFHGMLRDLLACRVPVLAAVRGACLGGGLELVLLAHRVFATPDARLGQPEIALGVFAPAASVVLPERLGRGAAEDLLLSGRPVGAEEALALGLVQEVVEDPEAAALAWARTHLLGRSAASLRFAVAAARLGLARRLERDLPRVEGLYLDELMRARDPEEGLRAFLEKRPPAWRDA